jgi:hypothetical protein
MPLLAILVIALGVLITLFSPTPLNAWVFGGEEHPRSAGR